MKKWPLLALLAATGSLAQPIAQLCHNVGTVKGAVCEVSIEQLQAHPSDFDGKWVAVSGFLAKKFKPVLFSSTESFQHSILANAIFLDTDDARIRGRIDTFDGRWVQVSGRFSKKGLILADYGVGATSGRLTSIDSLDPAAGPWGVVEKMPPRHGERPASRP